MATFLLALVSGPLSELKIDETFLTSGGEEIQNDEPGRDSSGPRRNPELREHAAQVPDPVADGMSHEEGRDQKHHQRVVRDKTSEVRGCKVEEQEFGYIESQTGEIGRDKDHPSDAREIERE